MKFTAESVSTRESQKFRGRNSSGKVQLLQNLKFLDTWHSGSNSIAIPTGPTGPIGPIGSIGPIVCLVQWYPRTTHDLLMIKCHRQVYIANTINMAGFDLLLYSVHTRQTKQSEQYCSRTKSCQRCVTKRAGCMEIDRVGNQLAFDSLCAGGLWIVWLPANRKLQVNFTL